MKTNTEEKLALSVAKIKVTKTIGKDNFSKEGTGFLWKSANQLVTAYHVVAGYDTIEVNFSKTNKTFRTRDVRIKKVFKEADLVLLEIKPNNDTGVPLAHYSPVSYEEGGQTVIGYQLGGAVSYGTTLEVLINPPQTLSQFTNTILSNQILKEIGSNGFNLDLDIYAFKNGLLPGDSGAPILDSQGGLIGIGHGGYYTQGSELCWCIQSKYIENLLVSEEIPSNEFSTDDAYWYGWNEAEQQRQIEDFRKNGNYDEVGKARTMARVVLSAQVETTSEINFLTASLFVRILPFQYTYSSRDWFFFGPVAFFDYLGKEDVNTMAPDGTILAVTTVQQTNFSFGIAAFLSLIDNSYVEASVAYPWNLEAKIGFNIWNRGILKTGVKLAVRYFMTTSESYQFNYFRDAEQLKQSEYHFKILLGLTFGLNDVLDKRNQ